MMYYFSIVASNVSYVEDMLRESKIGYEIGEVVSVEDEGCDRVHFSLSLEPANLYIEFTDFFHKLLVNEGQIWFDELDPNSLQVCEQKIWLGESTYQLDHQTTNLLKSALDLNKAFIAVSMELQDTQEDLEGLCKALDTQNDTIAHITQVNQQLILRLNSQTELIKRMAASLNYPPELVDGYLTVTQTEVKQ